MEWNEEPLPDQGFTRKVMARVDRHRRARRIAFAIATALAAGIAMIARPSLIVPSSEILAGALVLMTVCSLVWIETTE